MDLSYRSYCWAMGTTSFRMTEMNRKIELQLAYLDEFWSRPGMKDVSWAGNNAVQKEYYRFLKGKGFVSGEAPRPDKDAREKTSGLVELGLVDDERRLTPVGGMILKISQSGDFSAGDNVMELPRDSYGYLLQLLKGFKEVDGGHVRPFVVFLRVILSIGVDANGRRQLTWDEFSNLLPLCIDEQTTDFVIEKIRVARLANRVIDVDEVVSEIVLNKPNYKTGMLKLQNASVVSEELICDVGINRKSRQYDKAYFNVYKSLHDLVFSGVTRAGVVGFLKALEKLNGKVPSFWKKHFFNLAHGSRLQKDPIRQFRNKCPIFKSTTELQFRREFYRLLQLFKAKATLSDYADLNRRYFSLSDAVVFNGGEVFLDDMPRAFFERFIPWIDSVAFSGCRNVGNIEPITKILGGSIPTKEELFLSVSGMNITEIKSCGGLKKVMHQRRYSNFMHFLHSRFPKSKVSQLLRKFENRANDAEVQNAVTDAADIPTIFEYVVGLAWYYLSGEHGDVLEYLNLSLGPDFLPKSHAGGGEADILWQYDAMPPEYGQHMLLVEVTLAEKDNQRRMEMEPVSRHLGDYLISHPVDKDSYCTFVTTTLNPNVISDFRGKREQIYYNPANTSEKIHGMKIIPIETKVLSEMLERNMSYGDVYDLFNRHFSRTEEPVVWYKNLVSEIVG